MCSNFGARLESIFLFPKTEEDNNTKFDSKIIKITEILRYIIVDHFSDNKKIAQILIDSGAQLNLKNIGGWTALHAAACHGSNYLFIEIHSDYLIDLLDCIRFRRYFYLRNILLLFTRPQRDHRTSRREWS